MQLSTFIPYYTIHPSKADGLLGVGVYPDMPELKPGSETQYALIIEQWGTGVNDRVQERRDELKL